MFLLNRCKHFSYSDIFSLISFAVKADKNPGEVVGSKTLCVESADVSYFELNH